MSKYEDLLVAVRNAASPAAVLGLLDAWQGRHWEFWLAVANECCVWDEALALAVASSGCVNNLSENNTLPAPLRSRVALWQVNRMFGDTQVSVRGPAVGFLRALVSRGQLSATDDAVHVMYNRLVARSPAGYLTDGEEWAYAILPVVVDLPVAMIDRLVDALDIRRSERRLDLWIPLVFHRSVGVDRWRWGADRLLEVGQGYNALGAPAFVELLMSRPDVRLDPEVRRLVVERLLSGLAPGWDPAVYGPGELMGRPGQGRAEVLGRLLLAMRGDRAADAPAFDAWFAQRVDTRKPNTRR